MVAKIFAGVLTVAVLGTGGYVYWQSTNGLLDGCDGVCTKGGSIGSKEAPSCCSEESEAPSCCQSGTRASMLEAFAKACDKPETENFEVIAIQPREVK